MGKLVACIVGIGLMCAYGGAARDVGPVEQYRDSENWEFLLSFPMVWLPDISGEIDVDGSKIEVDKPISDTLEDLDMGFIGELYARKGPWSFGFRAMYLGMSSDTRNDGLKLPGLPPVIGSNKVTVESELFTSDLIAGYKFHPNFGLYTGVRRSGMKMDVRIKEYEEGLIQLPRKVEIADEDLYDWIAGVLLEYPFGENNRWRMAVEADMMIEGDNDENYQVNAFFSRRFDNERHALWFGYRYLQLIRDMNVDGSAVEIDFTQTGPTLGWTFIF